MFLSVIRFSLSLSFFLDGQQIWEMEATVDKDKSQPVCIKHDT